MMDKIGNQLWRAFCLFITLAVCIQGFSPVQPALAANCTVTSDADSGEGSLRALLADTTCETINFNADYTIHLASELALDRNVNIDGVGQTVTLSGDTNGDGTGDVRVFNVASGVTAAISNLTIEKGIADYGGAILNHGTLTVNRSIFSGNQANYKGGAISTDGLLTVTNSTFTGNRSFSIGGAVDLSAPPGATFTSNTFVDNAAYSAAGAIFDDSGGTFTNNTFVNNSVMLGDFGLAGAVFIVGDGAYYINNTFVGNSAGTGGTIYIETPYTYFFYNNLVLGGSIGADCFFYEFADIYGSNNLADDPGCGTIFAYSATLENSLGTLGYFGGPTQTIPLLEGSPAVDAGTNLGCPATDQRGTPRPNGLLCDVGAYELLLARTPWVTQQPLSQFVYTGDSVSFSAAAGGHPTSAIQWQVSTDDGASWSDIEGGAASPLTFVVASSQNGYQYRAVFTNAVGVATSDAATLSVAGLCTVTSSADSGEATLRASLADATCVMINFASDMTIRLAGTLTINRNVTIDGAGQSVTVSGDTDEDGTGDVRVFDVAAGSNVSLQNLTIASGFSTGNSGVDGFGGAIRNKGELALVNCSITGSLASHGGGGIYNGGMLAVSGSSFSGNSAVGGGAIYNDGYLSGNSNATTTITESTFSANAATWGGPSDTSHYWTGMVGGGAALANCYGSLMVEDNTFVSNTASFIGGAIASAGGIAAANNTFSGNASANQAGAIFTYWGSLTNNTFVNNTAPYASTLEFWDEASYPVTLHNNLLVKGGTGSNCQIDTFEGGNPGVAGSNNLADDDSCVTALFTGVTTVTDLSTQVGALGSRGGPTLTIPLLPGSAAIDAGDDAACPAIDQRGVTRQDGDLDGTTTCDIGSYEFTPVETSISLASSPDTPMERTPITIIATVSPAPDGGTMAFKDGGVVISGCAALPVTGGQASCTTSTMQSRLHFITAEYSGYGIYQPSLSAAYLLLVATPSGDASPPVISADIQGTLGQNGWYTSQVTLTWAVTDSQSAVTSQIGCDPVSIISDQQESAYTCTATSAGGTGSATVTIKRDATAPTLSPVITPDPVLLNGSATASPNASDLPSGVASAACDPVVTDSVGLHAVACTVTDNAGNTAAASVSYTVLYNLVGFSSPVDMNGVLNFANAGQMIPLKWRLLDANGNPVTNLDPASVTLTVSAYACQAGVPVDAIETYATGTTSLQNLGDGYYQLNWKTEKTYANTCKQTSLKIGTWPGDGLTALFKFNK